MATVNVLDSSQYSRSTSKDLSLRRSRLISKISFISKTDESITSADAVRPSRVFTIVDTKKTMPTFKMPMQTFITGSRYLGYYNTLGFSGQGIYRYPHGVRYEGTFNDKGEFHGVGTLVYPNKQKLEGLWLNGVLQKGYSYIYKCGEVLDENFKYCTAMDRRFHVEIQSDFGPAEQEYLTSNSECKILAPGCYDVGYGTYDAKTQVIIKSPSKKKHVDIVDSRTEQLERNEQLEKNSEYILIETMNYVSPTKFQLDDEEYISEIPSKSKQTLIQKYCRTSSVKSVGYDEKLYPFWMGGRKYEVFQHLKTELSQDYYIPVNDNGTDLGIGGLVSFIQRPHKPPETKRTKTPNVRSSQLQAAVI